MTHSTKTHTEALARLQKELDDQKGENQTLVEELAIVRKEIDAQNI